MGMQLVRMMLGIIICQYTSYVSTRQHTSTYVHIRPHTSAYVSNTWDAFMHLMRMIPVIHVYITATYMSYTLERTHALRSRVHTCISIYVHIYDVCDTLLWVKHVCQPHNQPHLRGFKASNIHRRGGAKWREDGQRLVPQNLIIKWYHQMGWLSSHWYWNFNYVSDYQQAWWSRA
jgi:hypothetical protein